MTTVMRNVICSAFREIWNKDTEASGHPCMGLIGTALCKSERTLDMPGCLDFRGKQLPLDPTHPHLLPTGSLVVVFDALASGGGAYF